MMPLGSNMPGEVRIAFKPKPTTLMAHINCLLISTDFQIPTTTKNPTV
jgi:hypothetical protein